ncbi:MAG: glycosyltransferase family 4 protein [Patescibacteria group bacterium]|jgi:glycosyltransferase involved in cell wall biosynthesis
MNILHLIDHVGYGGTQTILKEIFENQINDKSIFYYALRNNATAHVDIHHNNVLFCSSYSKFSLKPLFEICGLVKKYNIQILHCHLFRSQVFGWLIKKFFNHRLCLVFHEHGEIFRKKWWFIFFLKIAKLDINGWIAVSAATKTKLIETSNIPAKKIFVLYNFANSNKFNEKNLRNLNRFQIRSNYQIPQTDFVIGFLGRLDEIKSLPTLIKALPLLKFPFVTIVVGQGPEHQPLVTLAEKLNIKDKIRFINFQKDVLLIYSIIDILVLPSRSEASPMIFYESQMLGVPIIASDVPALNELIRDGENGSLFQYQNSKMLAQKITKFYLNKSFLVHIKKNSLINGKKFTISNFIKNLNAIYEQIQS